MSIRLGLTVSALALCGAGALALPAIAQEGPAAEAEQTASAERPAQAEQPAEPERDVIVVTAQKREQDIQDVPISMTAIGADKLETQGITNLENLSSYVPGVQIGKGAIYTPVNIRGVGSGSNRGFEQSVGMYVDGIYLGRDRQFRAPFLDLQRVEVLRGPQGILFGKNTIAGAISIVTADPSLDGEVSADGAVRWESETNTYQTNAAVTVPLGDTMAVRLAGQYRQGDGYITNVTRGRDEPAVEEFAGRATFLWEPTDSFTAKAKYSYLDSTVDGMNATVTKFSRVTGTVTPPTALANLVFNNVPVVEPRFGTSDPYKAYRDNPVAAGWSSRDAQTYTKSNLGVLDLNYDINDDLSLTSITGYSTYRTKDGLDLDFLPIRLLFRNEEQDFTQYSEELRLAYDGEGPVDFIGGVYFEKQDLKQDGALLINSRLGFLPGSVFATGPTAGVYPLLPLTVLARNSYFDQKTTTAAAFGEVTWNVTDDFRVAVGARYSEDEKDFLKMAWYGADASPQGLYTPPASVLQENVLLLFAKALEPNNNLVNAFASRSESGFDPSLKVQWDVTPDVMAYATYAEGRKSGGFNGNDDQALSNAATPWVALTPAGLSQRNSAYNPTAPGAGFEYEPEKAKSLEGGVKTTLLDGRMTLNASTFLTKYEDLQVTQFQGTSFVVANAQGAEIKGVELDGQYALTDELTLSGSLGYLDFAFSDYRNSGCTAQQASQTTAPCVQDLTGRPNAYAPELSGNIAVDWTHPISDTLQVRVNADANYKSEHYLDYDLDPASQQEAQTKVNARIGFGALSGGWEIAAFGQNLTDEVSYTSFSDVPLAPGAFVGFVQEPRTYGLEARVRY
ncbi:MAG TPA: TonB-dependent receptor [Hyphomonadaceae bacterium]|nr:TonB-dependent receptor [Hyphomonadaceae bacterium]